MKIKVNNVFLKYAWEWKISDEICLICQQEFFSSCPNCRHPIECYPCIGMCSHSFHYHCLQEWMKTSKECPICRREWEYCKIYGYKKI